MLGTANFEVSPLLAVSGGHLCYQIEHHLFPDLPSNRPPAGQCPRAGTLREVRSALQLGFASAPAVSDAEDHSRVGDSGPDAQGRRPAP
ncbi:MAG: fatty acid desaturase [Rhodococcus erythropolis]|nr:fatty acid desaturase [Rhodococcus erythropolis]